MCMGVLKNKKNKYTTVINKIITVIIIRKNMYSAHLLMQRCTIYLIVIATTIIMVRNQNFKTVLNWLKTTTSIQHRKYYTSLELYSIFKCENVLNNAGQG